MRTLTILTGLALLALMSSRGMSQYSVRESFDYAPGFFDISGEAIDGWGGPWTIFEGSSDLMNIEEGSLEFPGVPTSGNSLWGTMSVANDNQRAYRELATVWPDNGGSYWISYLMEINNISSNDQSWQGVSLYLNDGTELVLFGKVWGLPNLGLMAHTLGGAATTSALTWEEGLVWTVIRIDMSGDDQNERCNMWFNPNPASEPDTAIADVKADLQLNNGFERVVVHFGKFLDLETYFDELRLGTSFEDVSSPITGVPQKDSRLPFQFAVSQNYPNPFNPATNISYTLKSNGKVRLSVYDVMGREVAVLVDDVQNAGAHDAVFSGAGLASGVYFYKLQTADGVITKKMTLMK